MTNTTIRINKYLAGQGLFSRRKADEFIAQGRITINDQTATLGDRVDIAKDIVKLDGNVVGARQAEYEYWAVNKPRGVISTAEDEQGRDKVTDLVDSRARLFPVGRLDENSEGLIVLTNDGELTNVMTHPSFEHTKSYRVIAKQLRPGSPNHFKTRLEKGVLIDGRLMRAKEVTSIVRDDQNNYLEIELELITGYNRQIRRMCDKIGLEVRKLVRTGFGKLRLADLMLEPGQSVKISRDDLL